MQNIAFVAALALLYSAVLYWGCKALPGPKYQFLAALPATLGSGSSWQGVNITYYGVFQATSIVTAVAVILLMLASIEVSPAETLLFLTPILAVCIPASSWVARWVEKKPATLTVGGASFIGLLMAPWLALLIKIIAGGWLSPGFEVIAAMSALAIGYAFGEGIGRLACISYGCCYGKPLDDCPAWVRRLFKSNYFVFTGATKKATYEGGYEGRPLLPIQAVTSVVMVTTGLFGILLFLAEYYGLCLVFVLSLSHGWRAFSETLRADYRGEGKMSVYQKMAVIGIAYAFVIAFVFRSVPTIETHLLVGLEAMWSPGVIIGLEALWIIVLLYLGRSKTTGSTIEFHLRRDQI